MIFRNKEIEDRTDYVVSLILDKNRKLDRTTKEEHLGYLEATEYLKTGNFLVDDKVLTLEGWRDIIGSSHFMSRYIWYEIFSEAYKVGPVPERWLRSLHRKIRKLIAYFLYYPQNKKNYKGTPFVSGGIKEYRLYPSNSFFSTPERAWKAFCEQFILYIESCPSPVNATHTLPEIRYNDALQMWTIYSHLTNYTKIR